MKNTIEEYTVLFHNRASKIFFALCKDFKRSVTALDRQGDENVFQQMQGKYTNELKRELNVVASEVMERLSASIGSSKFNHVFNTFIEEYMQEFVQKARSL